MPNTTSTAPPITDIQRMAPWVARVENPATIKINNRTSTRAWPDTTRGPLVQPFFREVSIVAKSIGPGTSAPVRDEEVVPLESRYKHNLRKKEIKGLL